MWKRLLIIAVILASASGAIYAYDIYSDRYPATDNAYIGADTVHVGPQVSGQVVDAPVRNQQTVQAGDVLYRIEPRPFILAVDSARAQLEQVRQQVVYATAAVNTAEAEVRRLDVLLDNAKRHAERSRELLKQHFVSQQATDDAESEERAIAAQLNVARAKLEEAREQLGKPGEANQTVVEAKAALESAQWNFDHTTVYASCAGRIAEFGLRPGDTVSQGQANFVLICNDNYWVDANFKETDLAHIRSGQPATITVDMYPGETFSGQVTSINAASGVAFSLLPPQNASGNWVKVTQRVPVRIQVQLLDQDHPLLVGTSAQVRIDTTGD